MDEVIVVGDGPQPLAQKSVSEYSTKLDVRYVEGPLDHCVGHPQRNAVMGQAKGTHIVSIDDDDEYINDALSIMRQAAKDHPGRVIIFRMDVRERLSSILWIDKAIREGNVGTPMFMVPNLPSALGVWGHRYAGDFDFIRSTVDKWPGGDQGVVWSEAIIVRVH